jgi:malate synthase
LFNLISTFGETPEEALEEMNEIIRDLFKDRSLILNEFKEQFYMLSMGLFYDKLERDQKDLEPDFVRIIDKKF